MGGYWDQVARVNLTTKQIAYESPGEEFFRKYRGGATAVSYFLLKEVGQGADPLGPENKLIFAPGVITGAPVAGSGRNCVGAKSPIIKGFGKSEVGGYWGAELKRCGIDLLIIEGCSEKPVYLWINDGTIEIKDAQHLWGVSIKETQEIMKKELDNPRLRTALIGPGGERMVKYACIMNDLNHAAGRTGLGAVMGSKKLKGIAAFGRKNVPVSNQDDLKELSKWLVKNHKKIKPGLHNIGSGAAMEAYNAVGNVPTRNFHDGFFDDIYEILPTTMMDKIGSGRGSCFACPVRCKRHVESHDKYEVDPAYGAAEYEALAVFGADCGIKDIETISYANMLCNANTIDVISAGSTVAFAMECFERGILTPADTNNINLRFGNSEALIELLELIINRKGIGNLLAEGSAELAKELGKETEAFAMHAKGVEFGMHEPRLKWGLGLSYAVASHGGDHGIGIHDTEYTAKGPGQRKMNSLGYLTPFYTNDLSARKVMLTADLQRFRNYEDSLVICYSVPFDFSRKISVERAVTGWNTTLVEAMRVGERAIHLSRIFNLREGFSKKQDCLPERSHTPVPGGPLEGMYIGKEEFENALQYYYEEMGWDNDGVPKKSTLEKLEIDWAIV